MQTELLIIDPQNDFMPAHGDRPDGALAVPGATEDMDRLAAFIEANPFAFDGITVTLDSHNAYDIGHAAFWRDDAGKPPAPFTLITEDDIDAGTWAPVDEAVMPAVRSYLATLARGGRYVHTVWPDHCLVGTPGHAVYGPLSAALSRWSVTRGRAINWVFKGLNPHTEHYSAIKAEFELDDPHTRVNTALMARLLNADRIFVGGEALSHCVKATIEDLVGEARRHDIDMERRVVMLTDAMSPVPALPGADFPAISRNFLASLEADGARLAMTTTAL